MSSYKCDAVILQNRWLRETSSLVTAFTPRYGKITLTARGARKDPFRFEGALSGITRAYLLFRSRGSGGGMYLLEHSELLQPYTAIKENLQKILSALVLMDFTKLITNSLEPNQGLYHALLESLEWLDTRNALNADQALFSYLTRGITELGISPILERCVRCGKDMSSVRSPVRLSFSEGGAECADCARDASGPFITLSRGSLEHLKELHKKALTELKPFRYSLLQLNEIYTFLDLYARYHIGLQSALNSFRIFREIRLPEHR
jgi:DNA repair protein RecO (recombination protein O)